LPIFVGVEDKLQRHIQAFCAFEPVQTIPCKVLNSPGSEVVKRLHPPPWWQALSQTFSMDWTLQGTKPGNDWKPVTEVAFFLRSPVPVIVQYG
jgi:hypothetical protein